MWVYLGLEEAVYHISTSQHWRNTIVHKNRRLVFVYIPLSVLIDMFMLLTWCTLGIELYVYREAILLIDVLYYIYWKNKK